MTTNQSIKAIKTYLRINRIGENEYQSIIFDYDQAIFNHKQILQVEYEDGVFTLYTEDGDWICELLIDAMVELFPQVEYLVYCSMCNGLGWYDNDPYDMDKVECQHENLMYK